MVGRRHGATAFRPSTSAAPARAPSRGQATVMLVGLLAAAVALGVASFAVKPNKARSFDLFFGSLFIDDNTSPVAVDLASGRPTVRLRNAFTAVSAKTTGDLKMVPLAGGTLMLNPGTGEFNMVDQSGFVVKPTSGGVRLPRLAGAGAARAVAAGDSAYITLSSGTHADVYLVGQSTVASSLGAAPTAAKARASARIAQPLQATAGAQVSANGDLWVLTGAGGSHAVVRLAVPRGSNAGATLANTRRGSASGIAALAAATRDPDGTGGDVVAVASARGIDLYTDGGRPQRLALPDNARAVDGLRRIVPVSNQQGSVAFLYLARNGWNLVSGALGPGGTASVRPISGIAGSLDLVMPAQSAGRLYTMATNGAGELWQIDGTGTARMIAGAARYPILGHEQLDLAGAEVEARGSRVIFNARGNFEAVVVFSDDSHRPRVIDKHSAVQVDPNSAATLTAGSARRASPAKPRGKPAQTPRRPQQTVNDKISCRATTQQPHIPLVQVAERGSRSVQLGWTYPLLDPQDCAASTYTVAVKLVSGAQAPPPPATVRVQGQRGVNLTGLFPDSEYQLVVTAYINGKGTPAPPLTVRTSVEGPAAPTAVRTRVDAAGNWTVTWNSCGGVKTGCIPTASWQLIPRLCDGAGLAGPPPTRQIVGDASQHSFRYTYAGNDGLLGRGLSFQVEGIGAKGTIGTPAGDRACAHSWTPPVANDISLQASAPPITSGQARTRTTVAVHFRGGQTHDLGGVGGKLRFELLSNGSVVSTAGPTTRSTATLAGISAGQRYQVAVIAIAPNHPGATARIGPVNVAPAIARWPNPTVSATFHNDPAATGTLSIRVGFPAGTDTHGETFDLVHSSLSCGGGNTARELSAFGFTKGQSLPFADIPRQIYNSMSGTCRVAVQLQQHSSNATDPPLYGAGQSGRAFADVAIDAPVLEGGPADFTASWVSTALDHPSVQVGYTGTDPLTTFARNWDMQISNAAAAPCGRSSHHPPPTAINVVKDCATDALTVTVSFSYFGAALSFTVPVSGQAPAVDYTRMSLTAQWHGGSVTAQYSDGNSYDQATLSSLSWTFTVSSDASPGVDCGTSHDAAQAAGQGPDIAVDLTACPPGVSGTPTPTVTAATYTLHVTVDDPNQGSHSWDTQVSGTPQ